MEKYITLYNGIHITKLPISVLGTYDEFDIEDIRRSKSMNDYIKREDAIEMVLEPLSNMPSADVVEVVRCKDCKHHEELLNNNDGNVLCWVHGLDVIVDRNGYCNYGEREEQEHE